MWHTRGRGFRKNQTTCDHQAIAGSVCLQTRLQSLVAKADQRDPRSPDSSLYLKQMSDVRDRLNAVIWLAHSEQIFKGSHDYLLESMFLQLRKVLELIAFGSLTANQAKYAAAHAQFEKHWKAAKILKDLETVNPDFYPRPAKLTKVPVKGEAANYALLTDGFLTKDEFVFLYDISSAVIHTKIHSLRRVRLKSDTTSPCGLSEFVSCCGFTSCTSLTTADGLSTRPRRANRVSTPF